MSEYHPMIWRPIADHMRSCKITVRDSERHVLIRQAWNEAKKDLDDEGNYKEEFFRRVFPN